MAQRLIRSVAVVAGCFLAACAGPTGDPNKTASKALGVEGGTVATPGGVSVTIPAGALRATTLITIEPASADQARPTAPSVGEMYLFGPEGLAFDVPAKVKLEVDLTRLPAGYSIADVVVQRAPVGTTQFERLPTRVVDATHVEADTLHFSVFVPTLAGSQGDAGVDGGLDGGGGCVERCVSPNDGGADCECSRVCGQETLEIQCSGSSPLGCACVRNGVQVGSVQALMCPAASDLETLCGFGADAGVDGGTDGGSLDAGTDGGTPDGGVFDGGIDGGPGPDGGTDAGMPDGGFFDGGIDGGPGPDGGTDAGTPDGGPFDGGTDAGAPDGGPFDGGTDAGTPDGGPFDGGTDAGTPDGGPFDGGTDAGTPDGGPFDGGTDAGTPDGGLFDGGTDAGTPDGGPPDAGAGTPDGGGTDAGTPDAGPPDGGSSDGGPADSGAP